MDLPSTYNNFSEKFRKLEGQGFKIEDLETQLYALVVKNNELSSMVTDLEKKNVEDQEYIKLMNEVLNNVHLEYVWRAVKQVLRDINVNDFTDENYKEIMERACRILTEDKRDILKQAWNNFLLFFNERNKIGAEIKNINCVLKNTRVVMNNDVYKELYRYFTAAKSPTVYHLNKDVRNTALNLNTILKSYPSEKKRKSISKKFISTWNETRKNLKNTGKKTSNFLKKKRNQTRNFFKNKRQNITQKVENLRERLFGKKNNRNSNIQKNIWRKMYNSKTLSNEALANIQKNNFMRYNEMEHPFLRQQEEPTEARNMAMNSKKNKFPLLYKSNYNPYGYIDRVNGPSKTHHIPPPPPPRRGLPPHTQLSVRGSEMNLNKYYNSSNNNENDNSSNNNKNGNSSNNNENGNSSNNNNENNNPENTTTLTL